MSPILLSGWAVPPTYLVDLQRLLTGGDRSATASGDRSASPPGDRSAAAAETAGDRSAAAAGDRSAALCFDWQSAAGNYSDSVSARAAELQKQELAEQELGGQVCLIGWSTGAVIALETAIRYPHRVDRLILLSPTARFCEAPDYPHGADPATLEAMQKALHTAGKLRMFTDFFTTAAGSINEDQPHLPDWHALTKDQPAGELERALDYLGRTDLRDQITAIRCPTLILHGTRDRIIPVKAGKWVADHIPGAIYIPIPKAGHLLPLLHLDELKAPIQRFLSEH
jgi:pimeloyl-[acyl-carrier protein] methyl ester esterase